ncbi:MAG: pyruvate dehydrogenase (acetyl-transferring) E1 component subunit alpha [Chloroflexi bacterium]|nr:pyruvate dehydrogenase (acetyl-transferring) E1 component subunit alpha [Chloroflexota bacterium]MCI0822785.1 pyruvate dehydrogenase (acetyl-transferring) E1 component subunit alpha [Chloroflexota bacterium]
MRVALNLNKQKVSEYYRRMVLIRKFEEAAARLYMQGKIRGFMHLYIGQEAIAAGAISALEAKDYVITHYRDHGHALARGLDPKACMAELSGKATGTSGGKGGSMHLFNASKHFMGGHAIVAAHLPIATGLALASKYRGDDAVTACFFGDGAVNEGEFHEAMNLASLWKLPVLFFLENNLYGMGTHVEQAHAGGRDIYLAAEAYKIPAAQIDGMDVVAVHEATQEALKRLRSGSGPVFLEAMTYRYRGHSMSDPTQYRDTAEVNEFRENDPIERLKELALREGIVNKDELELIDREIDVIIDEATLFAEESPAPPAEALYTNVYA